MCQHAIYRFAHAQSGHLSARWRVESVSPGEFKFLKHRFRVGTDKSGTVYVRWQGPHTLPAHEGNGRIDRASVAQDPSVLASLSVFDTQDVNEAKADTMWKRTSRRARLPARAKVDHFCILIFCTFLCGMQGNPASLWWEIALPGANRLTNVLVQDGAGKRLLDGDGVHRV